MAIIAGDNIYPDKDGKTKKYLENTLNSGFTLLKNAVTPNTNQSNTRKINTHIVMGNHNAIPVVLDEQLKISNRLEFQFHKEQYVNHPVPGHKIVFHFLNTSEVDESGNEKGFSEQLISQLEKGLEEHKTSAWNIIVGHHPPILLKSKIKYHPGAHEFIECLKTALRHGIRLVYMCADVHNFHAATIDGVIPMIVAGVGGAEQDKASYLEPSTHNVKIEDVMHTIEQKAFALPYGFCSVQVTQDTIKVVYHQVIKEDKNDALERVQVKIPGGVMKVSINTGNVITPLVTQTKANTYGKVLYQKISNCKK